MVEFLSRGVGQKQVREGNLQDANRFPFSYDPRNGRFTLGSGISFDTAYYEAAGTATANGSCVFNTVNYDDLGMGLTSPSRCKVQSDGRYQLIYSGNSNAGVAHVGKLYKNNGYVRDIVSVAAGAAWAGSVIVVATAGDEFEIRDTAIVTTATLFQVIKMDNI
jgi:hypothetical protein